MNHSAFMPLDLMRANLPQRFAANLNDSIRMQPGEFFTDEIQSEHMNDNRFKNLQNDAKKRRNRPADD